MLREIKDERAYYLGWDYLTRELPGDFHIWSDYMGIGPENTVRMLRYDLQGIVDTAVRPEKYIRRFLSMDAQGKLQGAAIALSLPEFSEALDYERYVIPVCENEEAFRELFRACKGAKRRMEVITVRERERAYLAKELRGAVPRAVHEWNLYEVKPMPEQERIRKAAPGDLPCLDRQKCAIEAWPERYLKFAQSALPVTEVWALTDRAGLARAAAAILPYAGDVLEIKIAPGRDVDGQAMARFMRALAYRAQGKKKLVWRVKNPAQLEKKILEAEGFACVSREKHLHFFMEER